MNKILKKIGLSFLVLTLILVTGKSVYAEEDIRLFVKGEEISTDAKPFIEDGRTLVPIRAISENLGYKVDWNSEKRQVKISLGEKNMTLTVGDKNVEVKDGEMFIDTTIDVPAKIVNDRVFVPIRFIAESYGEKVDWDEDMRIVFVGEYKFNLDKDIDLRSRIKREYPELDLIMYLPKDFDQKIYTRFNIENNAYDFYTKDRKEHLASLRKAYESSYSDIIPTKIIKYEDGFFTEISSASDVQYTKETEKDYLDKFNYLNEVFSTIEFTKDLKEDEKYVAYINSIDFENKKINLNPGEFISINNIERRKELMLGKDSGPNVYDENEEKVAFELAEDCKFYLRERKSVIVDPYEVDYKDFEKHLDDIEYKSPFWVKFDEDKIAELVEIYIKPGE